MLLKLREHRAVLLACVIIALFLLPLYALGENAHIRMHDNLDSNIAWYKVLRESGQLFGTIDATIPQVITGLPRNAFGTEFSLLVWLHMLFPSMIAYAISQTIVRFVAFFGMYYLLQDHIIPQRETSWISVGAALAFSLTPFWPSGMLSTLGHPLALWAFLHIRRHTASWKHWLVILLLPLYSSFVLGFFFFLAAMGVLWLVDVLRTRRINPVFAASIVTMTALYLLIDYRLVYSLLFPQGPTSRNEFVSSILPFWKTIRLVGKNFAIGHTHVLTVHTYVLLPLQLFTLVILVFQRKKDMLKRSFLGWFALNICLSVWYAFWFYVGWQPLKERFAFLNTFNFARFHFLRPLVLYVLFALSLAFLWQLGKRWRSLVKLAVIAQCLILFYCNEEWYYRRVHAPSFKEFYAVSLFENIADYIGKPKQNYRVATIGLHPAIAQYNGFYTLDTYNNFYPLSYKRQFRKIIAAELKKNKRLKRYFDHWGGRCYLFSAELGKWYDYRKTSKKKIRHLQLNTAAFSSLGGRYIFSAVPIQNAASNHLRFKRSFEHPEALWRIYLYEVETQGE
ncbi:DUF6044 family protein [Ectobacillus funiculus]|uniref:DUF6044 family protein n=1 Tax=Ectobacillus funiculus TaxID=137993 RepID=A0ABV5WHM9_9BACI